MNRETFIIEETKFDDFTSEDGWTIDGIKYNFIDSYLSEGDGEWHNVIVCRESDNKYFAFGWGYKSGNYYYDPRWQEVFPEIGTKIIYK